MRCFCVLLFVALVTGCGGSGGGSPTIPPGGSDGGLSSASLRIWVTDSPFPYQFVESASVVIREVRVGNEAEGGWQTVFSGEAEIDLVPLTNGVETLLIEAPLPPGTYDQVRLIVDGGEVVLGPEAVVEDGIHEYNTANGRLKFPSGATSGLKVNIENGIVVTTGLTADLVLDFDLARQFVFNGPVTHPPGVKRVLFKPVVRAINSSTAGSLALTVLSDNLTPDDPADDAPLEGATVRILDADGNEVVTQSTGADGRAVISVPPGTYDVQVEASGHNTASLPAVQVVLANLTDLGNVLLAATEGEIGGVVMSNGGTSADDVDDIVVEGATVELFAAGDTSTPLASTTTDSSGTWRFEALAAGAYDIAVTADGFAPGALTNIAPEVVTPGYTILLEPFSQDLSGTVTVPSGVDVTTITIVVMNEAGVTVATGSPAADGSYSFTLPTGDYEVVFDDGITPMTFNVTLVGADPPPAAYDQDVTFE